MRVLFAAWPFHGHLFPQVALADALRSRGHACAFYTGRQMAALVEREGFKAFPFHHLDEDALDRLMQSRPDEPWKVRKTLQLGLLLRRWLLDTVPFQVRDLEAAMSEWQPDVIGTDPTMWAPSLVLSEKHRVPVAVCSFIPACPFAGPGAPPWGSGLPSRVRTWRDRVDRQIGAATLSVGARLGRRFVNDIRAEHGLPPITVSATDHMSRLPLYLVPTTREFDYNRHDVPPTVHYVGPYVWNRPRTEAAAPWIAELQRSRPCVHVTEGTVHVHAPVVLPAALKGLANEPLDVVMTTGSNREFTLPDPLPANFRAERFVSHSDLLPRTDVMVTTGGAGSVLASLSHGVPLVLVPTEWDKPEIAQRVVEAGAGIRIFPARCTPANLRGAVREVLENAGYRENARRLAESFRRAGGVERAVTLLEDVLTRAQATARA